MYSFEAHITIKIDDRGIEYVEGVVNQHLQQFKTKLITIGLGDVATHTMTSTTTVFESKDQKFANAFNETTSLIESQLQVLKSFNIEVDRVKLEACPKFIHDSGMGFFYVEIHVPCYTHKVDEFNSQFGLKWHKSSNEFKPGITMLTWRGKERIASTCNDINHMIDIGICDMYVKRHYEYAIIDTNIGLDSEWLN